MRPLVSIIIPVYNGEKTIEKCIDSVLEQTLKNIEIIVVNDNSTDNTFSVLKKYKNIKILNNETNVGPSISRNNGLDIARGQYVGFVDADDYIKDNMYEVLVKELESSAVDLVCCKSYWIMESNIFYSSCANETATSRFCIEKDLFVWNKLFKKSIIDKYGIRFPDNANYAEDFNFIAKYSLYSSYTKFIDIPCYYHVVDKENSISNSYNDRFLQIVASIEDVILLYKKEGYFEECKYIFLDVVSGYYTRRLNDFPKYSNISLKYRAFREFSRFFKRSFQDYRCFVNSYKSDYSKPYRTNYILNIIYILYSQMIYQWVKIKSKITYRSMTSK